MNRMSRREVLASLGFTSGAALLAGCGQQLPGVPSARADESEKPQETSWKYVPLDPEAVAATAYRLYPDGGCMYAVVGSIVTALAEPVGEPYRSFPWQMMRYGEGGVGGWGSVCGALNGAAAVLGLVRMELTKEELSQRIDEIFAWYESAELPKFCPALSGPDDQVDASIAGSILCHMSVGKWCAASGYEASCPERKERCRRLTSDVAARTVMLLNRDLAGSCEFVGLAPEVKSCIECHGKNELNDSVGKMSCAACHQFDKEHP